MKKRYLFFIASIVSILLLFVTGCTPMLRSPIIPPCGIIYTRIKAPCSTKYKETRVGEKRPYWTSFTEYVYEPFYGTSWAWGDASIQKIAELNKLKNIDYVDYEYLNVLGIYQLLIIMPRGQCQ